jgi:hypothetical protein
MTLAALAVTPLVPASLLYTAPSPIVPALFVAVFAVLTAFGYVLHARTVSLAPPAAPQRPLPPEERARAALTAAAPLADIDVRAYYGCIAAAMRAYLAERFAVSAGTMVRSDLETAMALAGVDNTMAGRAAALLGACDAAQFTGAVPDATRRADDLAAARRFIDVTSDDVPLTAPLDADASRPAPV